MGLRGAPAYWPDDLHKDRQPPPSTLVVVVVFLESLLRLVKVRGRWRAERAYRGWSQEKLCGPPSR